MDLKEGRGKYGHQKAGGVPSKREDMEEWPYCVKKERKKKEQTKEGKGRKVKRGNQKKKELR